MTRDLHIERSPFVYRVLLALAAVMALARPALAQSYEDFVFAVANDRAPMVKALLDRGMDPNTVDPKGEPALVVAARAGYSATIDVLLAGRADVNARSGFGDTALMMAALNGHDDIVRKLRARGGVLEGRGWTPLIYAATGGHDKIVTYLIGEGSNINAVSPNGTTALMMAVREGRVSTAELLLARGANPNVRNQDGASALDWALRGNETDLAVRLRKAGAKE